MSMDQTTIGPTVTGPGPNRFTLGPYDAFDTKHAENYANAPV